MGLEAEPAQINADSGDLGRRTCGIRGDGALGR